LSREEGDRPPHKKKEHRGTQDRHPTTKEKDDEPPEREQIETVREKDERSPSL
jgi:hypothetical protein